MAIYWNRRLTKERTSDLGKRYRQSHTETACIQLTDIKGENLSAPLEPEDCGMGSPRDRVLEFRPKFQVNAVCLTTVFTICIIQAVMTAIFGCSPSVILCGT